MNNFLSVLYFVFIVLYTQSGCGGNTGKKNTNQNNTSSLIDTSKYSADFVLDSIGTKGFRDTHCSYDSIKKTIIIMGKEILGSTKSQITSLLGKPNKTGFGREDHGLIMIYYIKMNNSHGKSLLIYFTKDGQVDNCIFIQD